MVRSAGHYVQEIGIPSSKRVWEFLQGWEDYLSSKVSKAEG